MNRSKRKMARCFSVLALACALTVSLCPAMASAEESGSKPETLSGEAGSLQERRDTADEAETAEDRAREEKVSNTKREEKASNTKRQEKASNTKMQEDTQDTAQVKDKEDAARTQAGAGAEKEKETQNVQQTEAGGNFLLEEDRESAAQGGETECTGSSEGAADTEDDRTGFSQTDPVTGISAEAEAGVFPAGTIMAVTPLESGESYEQLAGFLSAAADQFWICDISFFTVSLPDMSSITPVSPQGAVKIRMPVPEGYDTSRLGIYHIGTDGTIDETDFAAENGEIIFETDQFSLYAVVEKKEIKTDLPASLEMTDKVPHLELEKGYRDGSTSFSEGAQYSSPQTGDHTGLPAMAAQAAAALGMAAAAAGLKRYRLFRKNRA